jgi:hypothetical protein
MLTGSGWIPAPPDGGTQPRWGDGRIWIAASLVLVGLAAGTLTLSQRGDCHSHDSDLAGTIEVRNVLGQESHVAVEAIQAAGFEPSTVGRPRYAARVFTPQCVVNVGPAVATRVKSGSRVVLFLDYC